MKKVIISLFLVFTFGIYNTWAQCDESVRKAALQGMGDAQYIRDYSVNLTKSPTEVKTGQVKFNVMLNSRSQYRFNVVNGASNADDIVMQLYDQDRMLASNREGGRTFAAFDYIVRTSKVYQLVFSFPGGQEGCAEAVVSLVRQFSEGEMNF
ncbi:hypothetical protein [Natronoflexus pectinivorans]|uniref:Uncharacterized protein n=1 Tax=Natronoflexus pectinivorans TaxID=682526 RepID=A0A4R2GNP5_9BACT|nr:hypothetical protein [Natronoflexus pectinivorans]TCO10952.1 hypothetical protein EV194_101586 [Natronoflexus pectinivorans]